MESERLRLLIAYDGRQFRGWQSQATKDAVQDRLEDAFQRVLCDGQRITVHGAGRTDAGVHALGQVAHADVPAGKIPFTRWLLALNANLPHEIRVLRVTRARGDFHARFDARGKIYTYRIWNGPVLHPMEINRAWHVPGRLDIATIRSTAQLLIGTHDFASFAANRRIAETSTVRTIEAITLQQKGQVLTLGFKGDGFLYKMVRLISGSLIRCAQGRADADWIRQLLAKPGIRKTHFVAPAAGLYLTRVLYGR
jgi:tRNA pseudouridine38-40 synthase